MAIDSLSEADQFKEQIELHKFYLEQILKSAAFCLGVIGAIVAYVVTNRIATFQLQVALAPPLILSAGAVAVFAVGVTKAREFSGDVKSLQGRLGLSWRPHAEILVWMALIFAILFCAVSIGLIVLIAHPSLLPQPSS